MIALDKFRFSAIKILVVGDVMLDRYWTGSVNRISPEAPVPVVNVKAIKECAGGAGNVAANIVSLGAECNLMSFIGPDHSGERLKKILEDSGVNCDLLIDPKLTTTEKLRIVSRNQQLLRVDFESLPSKQIANECVQVFQQRITDCNLLVISDYGKGSLMNIEELIGVAKNAKIPVIVDPKGNDFNRYKGASIVTPNKHEFEYATGTSTDDTNFQKAAINLIASSGIEGLLVTQGDNGMSLILNDDSFQHQDAISREVYDVSGAGDTVVAITALGMAFGLQWEETLKLATKGASAVVGRFGTSVVKLEDLS